MLGLVRGRTPLVRRSAPEALALPFQLIVDRFEGELVTVDFRRVCFREFDDGGLLAVVSCRSSLAATRPLLCPMAANAGFERVVVVISSSWCGLRLLRVMRETIDSSRFTKKGLSLRWCLGGTWEPRGESRVSPPLVLTWCETTNHVVKNINNPAWIQKPPHFFLDAPGNSWSA